MSRDRSKLRYEVRPDFSEDTRWGVVMYSGGSGSGLPGSFETEDEAHAFVSLIRPTLDRAYAQHYALQEQRHDETMARLERERDERAAEKKLQLAAKRQRAAEVEAVVVTAYTCPDCDHAEETAEAFDEMPVRECSRCGQTLVGDDAGRCSECNIFTGRSDLVACPECEGTFEAPEETLGVWVDDEFTPATELEKS